MSTLSFISQTLQNAQKTVLQWLQERNAEASTAQMGLLSSSYIAYDNWPDAARHHMR